MTEPTSTAIVAAASAVSTPSPVSVMVGTVASSATTIILGPVIGQYAIILGMALLGTLVALAEREALPQPPSMPQAIWTALKFIFRGVALSCAFCGIATVAIIHLIPLAYGITPYAALSTVAFSIGWTTDRWGVVKDAIVGWVANKFK